MSGPSGMKIIASSTIRTIATVLAAFALAFLARLFVANVYIIPSESMEPTLDVGDRVIGLKWNAGTEARAGDIITFISPEDGKTVLIKRVVAVGGETVDIHDGKVFVNGQQREWSGVQGVTYPYQEHAPNLDADVRFPLTVPDDEVLVLGDNREDSADSRYFGCVPRKQILSRVSTRVWPIGRAGAIQPSQ